MLHSILSQSWHVVFQSVENHSEEVSRVFQTSDTRLFPVAHSILHTVIDDLKIVFFLDRFAVSDPFGSVMLMLIEDFYEVSYP